MAFEEMKFWLCYPLRMWDWDKKLGVYKLTVLFNNSEPSGKLGS